METTNKQSKYRPRRIKLTMMDYKKADNCYVPFISIRPLIFWLYHIYYVLTIRYVFKKNTN